MATPRGCSPPWACFPIYASVAEKKLRCLPMHDPTVKQGHVHTTLGQLGRQYQQNISAQNNQIRPVSWSDNAQIDGFWTPAGVAVQALSASATVTLDCGYQPFWGVPSALWLLRNLDDNAAVEEDDFRKGICCLHNKKPLGKGSLASITNW